MQKHRIPGEMKSKGETNNREEGKQSTRLGGNTTRLRGVGGGGGREGAWAARQMPLHHISFQLSFNLLHFVTSIYAAATLPPFLLIAGTYRASEHPRSTFKAPLGQTGAVKLSICRLPEPYYVWTCPIVSSYCLILVSLMREGDGHAIRVKTFYEKV